MRSRFECVLDPCNRYTIWDNRHILPVLHHGRLLSFATLRRAQKIAAILNDAAGSDAWPQPSARRQPTPRDGTTRASRALHAVHQHDPDSTNGSRIARARCSVSNLCGATGRTRSIPAWRTSARSPVEITVSLDGMQLFPSAGRIRKCGGGRAVRPFGRTADRVGLGAAATLMTSRD